MKFYTKEWTELLRRYALNLKIIPDKEYTEEEISDFYKQDLEEYLQIWRKASQAARKDAARRFLWGYRRALKSQDRFPLWVYDQMDHRLLALCRVTPMVYQRLKAEDEERKRLLKEIEVQAERVLSAQGVCEERNRMLWDRHDEFLLKIEKAEKDIVLYVGLMDQGEGSPCYGRLVFKDVSFFEREKGLVLRPKADEEGIFDSNCRFEYSELYKTDEGYEVHLMLWTQKAQRYLTLGCGDFLFEEDVCFPPDGLKK